MKFPSKESEVSWEVDFPSLKLKVKRHVNNGRLFKQQAHNGIYDVRENSWKQKAKLAIMKILTNCKTLLSCIGLTNELTISIGVKYKIPRVLLRCFTIVVLVLGTIFEILLCVKYKESGIYAVLFPLHITITILSMLLIYVGLLWRTSEIVELIDYMEMVVNQRKFLIFLWVFSLLFWWGHFFFFVVLVRPFFFVVLVRPFLFLFSSGIVIFLKSLYFTHLILVIRHHPFISWLHSLNYFSSWKLRHPADERIWCYL